MQRLAAIVRPATDCQYARAMKPSADVHTQTFTSQGTRSVCSRLFLPLLAVVAIAFANALPGTFTYDDSRTVIRNRLIRSWRNLPALATPVYFKLSGETSFRPLVTLSFFFDYTLWHLRPYGYHLSNILFHLAAASAVVAMCRALGASFWCAWFVGILFALHPACAETVSGISFRDDSMCLTAMAVCVIFYERGRCGPKRGIQLACSVAAFALALAAKEVGYLVFPFLLCREALRGRSARRGAGLFVALGGFLGVLVAYVGVRFWILPGPGMALLAPKVPTAVERLAIGPVATLGRYAALTAFPIHLNMVHDFEPYSALFSWGFWLGVVSVLLIAWGIVWGGMHNRFVAQGLAWLVLAWGPISGVGGLANPLAERHWYVPMVGIAMAVSPLGGRKRSTVLVLVPCVMFAALTLHRTLVWRDSMMLWKQSLRITPTEFRPYAALGDEYVQRGLLSRAQRCYRRALTLEGSQPEQYVDIGNVDLSAGRLEEAIEAYRTATRIAPAAPRAWSNLAMCYLRKGDLNQACAMALRALECDPQLPQGHYNLGRVYERLGRLREAEASYSAALRSLPDFFDAVVALGFVQLKLKKFEAARETLSRVAKAAPRDTTIQNNLGLCLFQLGKVGQAIEHYRRAIKIAPRKAEAHNNLGQALASQGHMREALDQFNAAVRVDPGFALAYMNRGIAKDALGMRGEAKQDYRRFLQLWKGDPKTADRVRAALRDSLPDKPLK